MNRLSKVMLRAGIAALALGTAGSAQAATITFSGVTAGTFTGSLTEAGFTYSWLSGFLRAESVSGNPGGAISGIPIGFFITSGTLRIVSSTPGGLFTFSGLDLVSEHSALPPVVISGLLGGSTVGSYTASGSGPLWTKFGAGTLAGINMDELQITLNAGGFYAQSVDNIVLTDVSSGVPEPATWATMLAGFGLMGASLRGAKARQRVSVRFG